MTWYRCGTGIPQTVKNMKTVSSASGSIATFDTDLTDNLVKCVAEIDANTDGVTSVTVIDISTLKNIPSDIRIYDRWLNQNTMKWAGSSNAKCVALPCQPDTTYVITGYSDQQTAYKFATVRISTLPDDNATQYDIYQLAYFNNYSEVGSAYCFTTDSQATFIVIQVTSAYANYFVENGTVATGNNVVVSLGETLTQGGTLDVISGLLTRTDTTTKQLTGGYLSTYSGINNILADTGDIEITYLETIGHKIS